MKRTRNAAVGTRLAADMASVPFALRLSTTMVCATLALVGCTIVSGADDLTTCSGDACAGAPETRAARGEAAEADGGAAAPSPADPARDAAPASKEEGVACGATVCSGDKPQCCLDGTATCVSSDQDCNGIRLSCDDPSDCSTGSVCCARLHRERATCMSRSACENGDDFVLCRTDADCPTGQHCSLNLGAIARLACH